LTAYADLLVAPKMAKIEKLLVLKTNAKTWLVMDKYEEADYDTQECRTDEGEVVKPKSVESMLKFVRVRIVTLERCIDGSKVLKCTCTFCNQLRLPCEFVLAVTGQLHPTMCHIRWFKDVPLKFMIPGNEEYTKNVVAAQLKKFEGIPLIDSIQWNLGEQSLVPANDKKVVELQNIIASGNTDTPLISSGFQCNSKEVEQFILSATDSRNSMLAL